MKTITLTLKHYANVEKKTRKLEVWPFMSSDVIRTLIRDFAQAQGSNDQVTLLQEDEETMVSYDFRSLIKSHYIVEVLPMLHRKFQRDCVKKAR
jgi:hypothetical protein